MNQANKIQNLASTPGANVLVSASAGTGKTKILTDRFIRLMLHGVPPEKILCLTFTNAAAAEMKHRIMDKLLLWRTADVEFLHNDLAKMGEEVSTDLCHRASSLYGAFHRVYDQLKIMTIHALCAEILKRFHSINNPNMQILEPYEATSFQLEIIKRTLSEVFSTQQEPYHQHFLFLSDYMDIQQIHKLINQLIFELNPTTTVNSNAIYNLHQADIRRTPNDIMHNQLNLLNKNTWIELHKALQQAEEKLGDNLSELLKLVDGNINPLQQWAEYLDLFLTKDRKPRQRLVNKKFSTDYPDFFQLLISEQEAAEECWKCYKRQLSAALNDAVVSLSYRCYEEVRVAKSKLGLLTFNDLISQTLTLLQNSPKAPGILYNLDYEIDHVLVDESQDNSAEQWEIIKTLTEEFFAGEGARTVDRTVFVVGDMKQSIFSFQGASPELFQDIGRFLADKVTAVNKPWHKLDMQISFRSTQTILNLVNSISTYNPLHTAHEPVEHIAHRDGDGIVEIWPLIERNIDEKQEGWVLPSYDGDNTEVAEQVASFIADKISDWLTSGRIIEAKQRPVQAGDIMILVRKRGNLVSALRRCLHQQNIKVIECSKSKLKDHIIIQDLLALLNFTLDNDDDLNLACLLKSPFFGISEGELFKLCYQRPSSVWQECSQQLEPIYKELVEIQQLKQTNSLLELMMHILYHKDKIKHFLTRFGMEANKVIATFLDAVCEFESKHNTGCYSSFLTWFAAAEIELQLQDASDADAVRIMTVHAAKGLQAPIVILADAASTEYSPPQRIYWHQGVPIIAINAEYDDELLSALKQAGRQQEDLENNRLLYVAMTRAEDELYIMGHKVARLKGSWYDVICDGLA